jgi:sulfur carrier protein ThiS
MEFRIEEETTVEEVLKRNGINLETVIVKKGDLIVTEKEPLKPGDVIEVIQVVSGG